jgi:hypothetical protein
VFKIRCKSASSALRNLISRNSASASTAVSSAQEAMTRNTIKKHLRFRKKRECRPGRTPPKLPRNRQKPRLELFRSNSEPKWQLMGGISAPNNHMRQETAARAAKRPLH